jgi:hypothetical protein
LGETSIGFVRRFLGTDELVALYAHPNQALDPAVPNDESAELLDRFLTLFGKERQQGAIRFETMAQVESGEGANDKELIPLMPLKFGRFCKYWD